MLTFLLYSTISTLFALLLYSTIKVIITSLVIKTLAPYLLMCSPWLLLSFRLWLNLWPIYKGKYRLAWTEKGPSKKSKREARLLTIQTSLTMILITLLWFLQAEPLGRTLVDTLTPSRNKSTTMLVLFLVLFVLNLNIIGSCKRQNPRLYRDETPDLTSYFKNLDLVMLLFCLILWLYAALTCEWCSRDSWIQHHKGQPCTHWGIPKLMAANPAKFFVVLLSPIIFFQVNGNYLLILSLLLLSHHLKIFGQINKSLGLLKDKSQYSKLVDSNSLLKYYWSHLILVSAIVVLLLYPTLVLLTIHNFRIILAIFYGETLLRCLLYLADKDDTNVDFMGYYRDGGASPYKNVNPSIHNKRQ